VHIWRAIREEEHSIIEKYEPARGTLLDNKRKSVKPIFAYGSERILDQYQHDMILGLLI
jgi:hypothetical protein